MLKSEITKEIYDELEKLDYFEKIERGLKLDLVNIFDVYGYGIDTIKLYQEDGKYYFEYTIYKGGLD